MTYITRNERGDFIIDFIEIKRTIKEHHDQSQAKIDKLD